MSSTQPIPRPAARERRPASPAAVGQLRIGLDYRPALLTSSGIARAVRELARALAARGDVELHLFAHSWAAATRPDPAPHGAVLHRWPIPGRSLPLLSRLGLDARALSGHVPLFHWTDYVHPPVRPAGPAVLTLHDLAFAADASFHGPESDALLARCRAAAARADVIVTPTHATAEAAAEALDIATERLRVVPFGVDHVPEHRAPPPALARPYVLALGTIEPRKNHRRLLEAWQLLARPRPALVVAGRAGWECADVVAALRRDENRGDLLWYPDLTDPEIFALVQHAAALAYPSLLEGFGFPPLEALALGTPVVAGDGAALREILGDAARFCDPRDPGAIAAALTDVLCNRELVRTLRERGLHRARRFTWERCAAAYAEVYRIALDRRP